MGWRSAARAACLAVAALAACGAHARGVAPRRAASAAPPFFPGNLNGAYALRATPGARGGALFPRRFADYPRGAEPFDVYSPPVRSLYGQVVWAGLPPVDLPADVVARYAGRGMAVVGFELDQVRRGAGPGGADESLPITYSYNHHFESTMIGAGKAFERRELRGGGGGGNPNNGGHAAHSATAPHDWAVVDDPTEGAGTPGAWPEAAFGGANGGEARKSFHGYAPGFAQVVSSPTQFQVTPMQIDTWHRDAMPLGARAPFVAGPLPRSSPAPPGAPYSGLLECPRTTRVRAVLDDAPFASVGGRRACAPNATAVEAAGRCFEAAKELYGAGVAYSTRSFEQASRFPPGCSAQMADTAGGAPLVEVTFAPRGSAACGQGSEERGRLAGVLASLVTVRATVAAGANAGRGGVTLELTGPSDVWFGVGFDTESMSSKPWTIIVEPDAMDPSGVRVHERNLAGHAPGSRLNASLTLQSSELTAEGLRRVVLTRPSFAGPTADYYDFSSSAAIRDLFVIDAVGSAPVFGYHRVKGVGTLRMLPTAPSGGGGEVVASACVCAAPLPPFGQARGKLVYTPNASDPADIGGGSIVFNNQCAPQPRSDLLAMRNPTCDMRTYAGGQIACQHGWSLLDADQPIPWADQPLEFSLKFRFWVQPYNASYHQHVSRVSWGIASPVEFDVPQCAAGVPGCSFDAASRTWLHTITGTYEGSGSLVAAHFHCHAPTCMSISMYRCDNAHVAPEDCSAETGTLLCEERPIYGQGGEGRFDEEGFIAQPPCLWGSAEFGLEPPVDVAATSNYTLHSVKVSNATVAHTGEMAWQQMYVIDADGAARAPEQDTGASAAASSGRARAAPGGGIVGAGLSAGGAALQARALAI